MVSKETSERVQLCQRYFDDMLARAHSANDDLQEASRKLTDALKAWEREFFSCDEPKTNRTKSQPAATFWCPACKQTSVADQNDDGTYTCPHCGQ